jgi:hypothetical protein
VPGDESTILVPLRSNGSTLLNGAPVAALRRRLKYASIFFERLLLESGMLLMNAGPSQSVLIGPFNQEGPHRWQTGAARHGAKKHRFFVAMGWGDPFGPLPAIETPGTAETAISWAATLDPFADEFPPNIDWVEFENSPAPRIEFTSTKPFEPVGSLQVLADQMTQADEQNPALEQAIPESFMRDIAVSNVNHDQAYAAASGFALTIDSFHQRVVAQRFNDDITWRFRGYIVPIIVPEVGELPWEILADLRRDRSMVRFRAVLKELEDEALAKAAGGDIEAAAHHAYERYLEKAAAIEDISVPLRHTAGGLLISAAAGAATSPLAGIGGIIASTLFGSAIGGVLDARSYMRQRRSRGWIAVVARIRGDGV